MVKISSEKKREYNKKFREKQKEQTPQLEISKVDEVDAIPPTENPQIPPDTPTEPPVEDDETYTIDKETMAFLVECLQSKKNENITDSAEETKEKPAEEKKESSFFFQMKQAMYQQLAITVPLIALKLIADGVKFSIPSTIQHSHFYVL